MEKISWTDSVRNENIAQNHTAIEKRRKTNWIGHHLLKNCFKKALLKEKWREG
jgi:hypothetical protein